METSEFRRAVEAVFCTLMDERGTPLAAVDAGCSLYDGGYGLDSMDTATLSAMLSERFEDDPYMHGIFPKNIGEIVAYYSDRADAR
jgi:acyl carrier protein